GMLAKVALHCVQTIVPLMPITHQLAYKLSEGLEALGFKIVVPCQTNMVFVDFSPLKVNDIAEPLLKEKIKISNTQGSSVCRIVLHYQIPSSVIDTFLSVAESVATLHKIEPKTLDSAVCSRSSSVSGSIVDLAGAYPSI
ncbi:hypothetical protein BJ944DRAFT_235705, partial [Cunninghamella echinulata]